MKGMDRARTGVGRCTALAVVCDGSQQYVTYVDVHRERRMLVVRKVCQRRQVAIMMKQQWGMLKVSRYEVTEWQLHRSS